MSAYPQPSDEEKAEAKKYSERHALMKADRANWENHWQQCMSYIVPRKDDITSSLNPGVKKNDDLFDTTAIMANQLLGAALHGMLTNPSMRFFELVMGDPALDGDESVRAWLQEVADRMFVVMNNSNFQTEIHEIYIDQGAIGTACLYMGEHPEKIVHFNARNIREIYVDENNLGLIDTVNREFSWKPKQIVQEFGEKKVPDFVIEKYRKGCDDPWKVLHSVHPNESDDPSTKHFKFKSVYMLMEQEIFLSKSGFREFPYAVPRWTKTSGETYGRGPGMEMLPDIKMVNVMMETTIRGAQLTVAPPLMVPDDGVLGRVRLTPFGLTIMRPGAGEIKPLITDARIDFGQQVVEDVRKRIRSGFYVDQLQLKDGPQMTATEVNQRAEEMLRLMGPVLGRQNFELLRPLIERVFGIMNRLGKLSPAPGIIQGKSFDVRYSSLAARAQRASDGQNLSRALNLAAPIIQAKPEVLDNINGDAAFQYIGDIYGVPQSIMNTDQQRKDIRDARAKAQQQIVQQQKQQHEADIASKVGPAAAQLQQASKQQ